MREYKIGDVVQVTKSGKHNGKIGVIVVEKIFNESGGNFDKCHVSFDLNEVPLDKTFDFYNTRNGANSSWYNTSNVEPASYEDSFEFMREQVISLSSNIGKTIQGKNLCINEVDKEKLVNAMKGAIQFKKDKSSEDKSSEVKFLEMLEDVLREINRDLNEVICEKEERIQELEEELYNAYFDVAERDRRINDLDMNDIIKEINNLKKELVNINEKLEQVHRLSII